ncbi:phage minor head protein [Seonamhaeicola sp.]|uniref:phage minor head protein n=1 Tax=Seonamhaeicola sp. TaxID=1912245 RepID=UPI003563D0B5
MPKPTNNEKRLHQAFLRRQKVYEKKYVKQFYNYLASINYAVARYIDESGINSVNVDNFINYDKVEDIYKKLYNEVTINEAKIQWEEFGEDLGKKDLIDDIVGIMAGENAQPIQIWRSLMNDFIQVRIAGRITEVNTTTRKRIAVLIERGIAQGLGAKEVAKMIRADRKYNKNRSLAIARTETITSANQGKYMAALSSPFVKLKKWLPTLDSRTRLSHADFYDRPFVDMEQPFYVANAQGFLEEARYPCDASLTASNVVNCRCIVIFKNKLDENGRPIRKVNNIL